MAVPGMPAAAGGVRQGPALWRLAPGQQLRFCQFGDEFVLYNDLSGDTHLLGHPALHVLGLLRAAPMAPAAVLGALAGALGCARDEAFDADGGQLLAQLAALCLIEAAP